MKKIINIALWIMLSAALLVLLGFAVSEQKKSKCKKVEIKIEGDSNFGFINENEIYQIIITNYDTLKGWYLDSINTMQIRTTLLENPYIKSAEITKTLLGTVRVNVERHEPLVRIVNQAEEQFYIGRDGAILPASKQFFPRIITATGYLKASFSKATEADLKLPQQHFAQPGELASISYLASKLEAHPNLKNYIQQIYFNKNGEIELVPASGDYIIILGDVFELDTKLRNFMAMYHAGYLREPVKFRSINLKYTNQVVCKK